MSWAKNRIRFLKEAFGSSSEEEYISGDSDYISDRESSYEQDEYESEREDRRRFLRDDQIYQDNGYDSNFDLPGGYDEYDRMRREDDYGLYENRKRRIMKESARRKAIRRK